MEHKDLLQFLDEHGINYRIEQIQLWLPVLIFSILLAGAMWLDQLTQL
jgi:hypothetical protein